MIHGALRDGRRRAAKAPLTRFSFLASRPTRWPARAFATSPAQGAVAGISGNVNATRSPRKHPGNSPRTKPRGIPKQSPEQLLELCLPPHLRSANGSTRDKTSFVPDAPALAKLALEEFSEGNRFLKYLAVDQGRWRAAVWIVKLLLEHYHEQPARSDRLSHIFQAWTRSGTLDEATEDPLYLVPEDEGQVLQTPHIKPSFSASLDELTDYKPDNLSRSETLRHRILGLIWRDIGRLIIECSANPDIAGGEVKPDILEMIALLHHYELMPASIYAYVPAESEDALQQPPTLHLLSRRIFTALSDATWRARESTAVEEAKRKGGELMGLEAKGSSYRVRVSGIKPEIWLELTLWSCLHGGWIAEGASLLRSLSRSKEGRGLWTPISWRDSLKAVMPFEQADLLDWDNIKYVFDTRSSATMDGVDLTDLRVDKTVSSEVVNAYIDALLNVVSVGVGERGLSLSVVIGRIQDLRKFLKRANLNLGGGSWDAMIVRLVESGAIDIDVNPAIVQQLVSWSPPIGEELRSRRSQSIPAYVLDGSAVVLGLLHRALYAEIRNNNLEGALRVFKLLQERVDHDRHQSLSDFFAHKHLSSVESDESATGLFTSNFSGIDYPSFSTQIPPTTLAAFLELVIANSAFDLGNWMLGIDNTDIDGPIIPTSLYSEPSISAAVVHYATATNNSALLSKATKFGTVQVEDSNSPTLPNEVLQAFFNAQVGLQRWDAAIKILVYMRDTEHFDWSVGNAATVAKAMIDESGDEKVRYQVDGRRFVGAEKVFSSPEKVSVSPEQLFVSLLNGKYGITAERSQKQQAVNSLCVVLSTISPSLAALIRNNHSLPKHFVFNLRAGAFNSVLEGVVTAQGSVAGRDLVNRFAIAQQPMQRVGDGGVESKESPEEEEYYAGIADPGHGKRKVVAFRSRMPRFMKDAIATDRISRTDLSITCAGHPADYEQNVTMYGGFRNVGPTTVRIVVRQALLERARGHATPQDHLGSEPPSHPLDIFVWAFFTLRRAGFDPLSAQDELESMETGLSEAEMRSVRERATEMWRERFKQDEGREPDAFDLEG